MISRLIGGFVAILLGTALVGPVSDVIGGSSGAASTLNSSGGACQVGVTGTGNLQCQLYTSAFWGATVLKLVPGFFALGILGIGIAVTYGSLKDAGVV